MTFLAAAAPFLAVGGSLIKGVGGIMAGNAKKKADYAQAREDLLASNEEERAQRDTARKAIGSQLAAQYDNGLEGGSGTALDAVRESQINAALDAMSIRRQGVGKALSLQAEGRQAQTQGYIGAASDLISGLSQAGGMKSDWAQARSGVTH